MVGAKLNVIEAMMTAEESGFDFKEPERMKVVDDILQAILDNHEERLATNKNVH